MQLQSVKNAVFYVMRNKQTQKCSCGAAQLHVACSDFIVGWIYWAAVVHVIPAEIDLFLPLFIF